MNEAEISSWLELIKHDYETADLIVRENGHPDIAIYHYHQATEKYLKVLLLLKTKQFPKIHYLDKLAAEVIQYYPEIKDIIADILFIDKYLPRLRYPVSDNFTRDDLLNSQSKFKNIKVFVEKII